MGRTAKNVNFFFGRIPMFYGKDPVKVFTWLQNFFKACNHN